MRRHLVEWLTTALLSSFLVANLVGNGTGWWKTLCTKCREWLPAWAVDLICAWLGWWLPRHYRKGFRSPVAR
ncbi:MAG TPA: hypothetical protein VFK41_03160 [Nocardioidaceae bacterium]|nr:hypothetical protein [Nocardioidaceae bacterium]